MKHMLTFNGNINGIERADHFNSPPRRCPGYENATSIIEFLIDRYCPKSPCDAPDITQRRLTEVKANETSFQKFILKMGRITYDQANKYFPTASDVKHPLETTGKKIGSMDIVAAGERKIPVYGRSYEISATESAEVFDR